MLDDIHFSLNHPSSFFQLSAPPAHVIPRIDGQVVTDTPANHPWRGPLRAGPSMLCDQDTIPMTHVDAHAAHLAARCRPTAKPPNISLKATFQATDMSPGSAETPCTMPSFS